MRTTILAYVIALVGFVMIAVVAWQWTRAGLRGGKTGERGRSGVADGPTHVQPPVLP